MNMNVVPSSAFLLKTILVIAVLISTVLGQEITWSQINPAQMPVQFTPLPMMYQNWQSLNPSAQAQFLPKQGLSKSGGDSLGSMPAIGGKLRLLSTLFGGLRNSGLESTIAGEIIQRLIKTALRDIVVPFKRDVFSPLMS